MKINHSLIKYGNEVKKFINKMESDLHDKKKSNENAKEQHGKGCTTALLVAAAGAAVVGGAATATAPALAAAGSVVNSNINVE